ncbi:MAG: hypothetical protein AAF725_06365 [Acidobacteriota bacterium]
MRSTRLPSWVERLAGLEPVAAPPHVFALDARELRYAAFHRGPQGFAFDSEQSVVLPAETFAPGVLGGPLREPKAFAEALESLLRELGGPVTEASLVIPDTWMRLAFAEFSELPKKPAQRQEVLVWKLTRLVPFRVEDLRVSATEVTPFPNQAEPLRLLLGFAIETLLEQIESAFSQAGVRLGLLTNETLALMSSLEHSVAPEELAALVAVFEDSYTVSFFRPGEPMIYRYKAFTEGGVFADAVARDLRMTATFMREHFPNSPPRRAFLAVESDLEEQWLHWIQDELEIVPEPLGFDHFQLTRSRPGASWLRSAPMLGAAALEIL